MRIKVERAEAPGAELDLVLRARNGDDRAFAELMRQYQPRVASIAYQMLGNYDDARDVAQEVFIKLHRNLGRFDPKMKFFTWLYRMTVNASIDYIRSRKRRQHETSLDEHPEQFDDVPNEVTAAAELEQGELRKLFLDLAAKLSPRQRAAFVLSDLQGFSADEAAAMLGCPKTTLRWYLHQARKAIRTAVARDYPEYWREKWE